MLSFLLGLGMPVLCQDGSKFSETGEAFVLPLFSCRYLPWYTAHLWRT